MLSLLIPDAYMITTKDEFLRRRQLECVDVNLGLRCLGAQDHLHHHRCRNGAMAGLLGKWDGMARAIGPSSGSQKIQIFMHMCAWKYVCMYVCIWLISNEEFHAYPHSMLSRRHCYTHQAITKTLASQHEVGALRPGLLRALALARFTGTPLGPRDKSTEHPTAPSAQEIEQLLDQGKLDQGKVE